MLIQLVLLIFLLLIIFLITKNLTRIIYSFIQKVIRNQKMAVWLLAIFFLPGTVFHELSHFVLAILLRVPTGPISILPSFERGDTPAAAGMSPSGDGRLKVRTGHIMVAKTDPIRMTLIGVAPMIIGLVIIYFVGNSIIAPEGGFFGFYTRGENLRFTPRVSMLILGIYLLFITSTTMFSSKQDLKSLLITLPFTLIILAAFYLTGIKVTFEENLIIKITGILSNLNRGLIVAGVTDYVLLVILTVLSRLGRLR